MTDKVGTIYSVYEIVESQVNPVTAEWDGHVNSLFSKTEPMLAMLDSMDLHFCQAGFVLSERSKPTFGHTFDLEAALPLLDDGITLELVYEDEYENPYYFKVRRREVY